MALSPNFTASVSFATQNLLHLEDTSTGSDAAIDSRRVYLTKADGTYLVPQGTSTDYIVWSYSVSFIDIDVLDRDYALTITVEWLNDAGVALYTKVYVFDFTTYSNFFHYYLTQTQASQPNIINDNNFWYNKLKLLVNIKDADNAIAYGSDVGNAQEALNRAYDLINKQNLFF
jgi:hypothetical protein